MQVSHLALVFAIFWAIDTMIRKWQLEHNRDSRTKTYTSTRNRGQRRK